MTFTLTDDHRYLLDGHEIPGLTETLKSAGLVDTTWFTEYSRQRGGAVHKAIRFHLEGDLNDGSVDHAIRGYVVAAKRVVEELHIKPMLIETPLYCSRHDFGCTPDVCATTLNGAAAIVEWKTGPVDSVVGLQLAGQQLALEERFGVSRFVRYGVKLNDNGRFKICEFTRPSDKDVLLAALTLRKFKADNGIT